MEPAKRQGRGAKLWRDLLEEWGLAELQLKAGFVQAKFAPNDPTRKVAWDLYVELLTRIATQPLDDRDGDEAAALASLVSLFPTTREILRAGGPKSVDAAYVAIAFLNQVIRPFTSKWHVESLNKFQKDGAKAEFRADLKRVQGLLAGYTDLMGELSGMQPAGRVAAPTETATASGG